MEERGLRPAPVGVAPGGVASGDGSMGGSATDSLPPVLGRDAVSAEGSVGVGEPGVIGDGPVVEALSVFWRDEDSEGGGRA